MNILIPTAYACLFIVLAIYDIKYRRIPDKIIFPSLGITLLLVLFLPHGMPSLQYSLIGGVSLFTMFGLLALSGKGGMGWGDAKMAGLAGFVAGLPGAGVVVILALVAGGAVAAVLSLKRYEGRALPFAPCLALGGVVTLFYGNDLVWWVFIRVFVWP